MVYNSSRDELVKSSEALFKMVLEKKIKPCVSKIYSLKDVEQAHKDLESRKTFGSLVLKP